MAVPANPIRTRPPSETSTMVSTSEASVLCFIDSGSPVITTSPYAVWVASTR